MQAKQALLAVLPFVAFPCSALTLNIATVNNAHMQEMQKLSEFYTFLNPEIKFKWEVLEEATLRKKVTENITQKNGSYDIVTIGMYETPIWAQKGWLKPLKFDAKYDLADILPPIRAGLTYNNQLYAAPFYGESSITMYRKDLFVKAGIKMPSRPTWQFITDSAAKLNDPANGVYGICLRGQAGWGANIALVSTIANAYGGQYFDMNWKPQLNSAAWKAAVGMYVNLLQKYGPADAANNNFNENLALFQNGKCAIWVDASVAATFVTDPKHSKVSSKTGVAQAPSQVTTRGANWLWAWALAIPQNSKQAEAAKDFIAWSTSKDYVSLVAHDVSWYSVPTGTRKSTYDSTHFQLSSLYGKEELAAIMSADPTKPTLPPSPYKGIQFASIPEFQPIGDELGRQVQMILQGKTTIDQGLNEAQQFAAGKMKSR